MLHLILFLIFAALCVGGAINLLVQRHPINSALSLVVVTGALALIYLLLGAEFVAAIQIIIYAGAVMVLFIFVIMLVNLDVALHQLQFRRQWWLGLLLALALGAEATAAISIGRSGLPDSSTAPPAIVLEPNTESVGRVLFTGYLLPLEIASVLLLVAMVGAVVMAKRRT